MPNRKISIISISDSYLFLAHEVHGVASLWWLLHDWIQHHVSLLLGHVQHIHQHAHLRQCMPELYQRWGLLNQLPKFLSSKHSLLLVIMHHIYTGQVSLQLTWSCSDTGLPTMNMIQWLLILQKKSWCIMWYWNVPGVTVVAYHVHIMNFSSYFMLVKTK